MKGRRGMEGEKKTERKGKLEEVERRREMRQGLTCSDWQPCFSQFGSLPPLCFCEGSRNTSSAIHLISIPTPASHLHSVSFCLFLSFLRMPLHFLNDNAVAISLAIHSPGHNVTCIQSWENSKPLLETVWIFFSFFFSSPDIPRPFTLSPAPPLEFPPATYPPAISWSNPDLCYVTLARPRTAQLPPTPPGTLVRIICLTSPRQQMSEAFNTYND